MDFFLTLKIYSTFFSCFFVEPSQRNISTRLAEKANTTRYETIMRLKIFIPRECMAARSVLTQIYIQQYLKIRSLNKLMLLLSSSNLLSRPSIDLNTTLEPLIKIITLKKNSTPNYILTKKSFKNADKIMIT